MTPITVTSPRPLPLALVADADAGSREMYVESMKLANRAVVEAVDGPPPPELICPECDRPLDYKIVAGGGVSVRHTEQWDYFVCGSGCGTFQYRQRTRKLRKMSGAVPYVRSTYVPAAFRASSSHVGLSSGRA